MKKSLFILFLMSLIFVSCTKDNDLTQDIPNDETGILSFSIQQADLNLKDSDLGPHCSDDFQMDYAVFTINGQNYTSEINGLDGEYLTEAIHLPIGVYTLSSFVIYSTNGTADDLSDDRMVKAAPLPGSEYYDMMLNPIDLEVIVEAFYEKQIPIDILCWEPMFYKEFGFTWLEVDDIRIENQNFHGDICVDDYELYDGSIYGNQSQGIQFDMPAIFEIKVYKQGEEAMIDVFSNEEWLGEDQSLEVQWPNNLDVDGELFDFELWVLLPTAEGFEYVLMDTWTVTDDDTGVTGENGVVDFVIGSCLHADADYVYQYDFSPLGTGDVQVTLRWDNDTDLDLWVTDPSGELISYQNPTAASGGILDVDDVNGYGPENIFWPTNGAPEGDYTIQIDYFEGDSPTHYTIDILFFGNTYSYSGVIGINELVDIVVLSSSKSAIPTVLNNRHKIENRPTK